MESTPLTFGELKIGDHFVDFPTDGDDSGHGGFRKGAYVFQKIKKEKTTHKEVYENAVRLFDKNKSGFPDAMTVYKVIL